MNRLRDSFLFWLPRAVVALILVAALAVIVREFVR